MSCQMLFTWDTTNLCVVFRSWRITGPGSLVWSLLAIMALTAGYEAVREAARRYEDRLARRMDDVPRKSLILILTLIITHCFRPHRMLVLSRNAGARPSAVSHTPRRSRILPRQSRGSGGTTLTARPRDRGRHARAQGQGGQGRAVRPPGVLLLLHHVSWDHFSIVCLW